MINSNRGTLATFSPHSLASSSSSSSRAPPRALRENLEKTLASLSAPVASSQSSMASSSSSPSMEASNEATTKPASSVVMPPEGLVILASAVIETTGGDHKLAALEPLDEEPDSHKGDWRGSDITGRDIQEMVAEGYLPATEGLPWRAAPAGEVTPSPQAGEKVYLKAQLVRGVSLPISHFFLSVLNHYKVQPHNLSPIAS